MRWGQWSAAVTAVVVVTAISPATVTAATWSFDYLESTRPYYRLDPGLDPDAPALRYGWVGRWRAMGGGSVLLFGARSYALDIGISLDGFVELVNFTNRSPVPWETFRGFLGVDLHFESTYVNKRAMPPQGRLILKLGWFHESDHAVAVTSFINRYGDGTLNPSNFENGDLSSYEHFKIRGLWVQELLGRMQLQLTLGGRIFTPPIDPYALRELRWSLFAEARLTVRVRTPLHVFVGVFTEVVDHRFDTDAARFRDDLADRPLRYLLLATGIEIRGWERRALVLQLLYSYSHGRGLDFAEDFGHELGVVFELWM